MLALRLRVRAGLVMDFRSNAASESKDSRGEAINVRCGILILYR